MTRTFPRIALFVSAAALAGCGGTSGGSQDPGSDGSADAKTFVRGPLTGFGSVVIKGVRYKTATAQFEVDDRPGSETELEIGQIVELRAKGDEAVSVRYDAELEGPVQSVDIAGNRFVALGQTVIVESTTVFEDTSLDALVAGDLVEVSGERDANGDLHAAYIELKSDAGEDFELKGTVANHDMAAQTFTLNALTVDYSGAVLEPSGLVIADGQFVEVEGSLAGEMLVASEIELEDRDEELAELESQDEMELEGFVERVASDSTFVLNGFTVRHTDDTEFEDGSAAEIAVNSRLEVEGRVDADGVLVAETIEFEDSEERELAIEIRALVQSADGGSVTILGITVQVMPETRVRDSRDDDERFGSADIQPGDYLEISAFLRDGAIVAGVIERDEPEEGVSLSAPLTALDEAANMITVQGVTADVSGAEFEVDDDSVSNSEFFAAATVGDSIEIEGSFDGSLITASQVELEREDEDHDGDDVDD